MSAMITLYLLVFLINTQAFVSLVANARGRAGRGNLQTEIRKSHSGNFKDIYSDLVNVNFRFDISPLGRDSFFCKLKRRRSGEVVLTETIIDPIVAEKYQYCDSSSFDNYYAVSLCLKGRQEVYHRGKKIEVSDGSLYFWDTFSPMQVEQVDRTHCLTIFFGKNMYKEYSNILDKNCGNLLFNNAGSRSLLDSYLRSLHSSIEKIDQSDYTRIFKATLELISCCSGGADYLVGGSISEYQSSVMKRVLWYINENILSPDLNAASVASQFGFSVRYLHMLFSKTGCSFAEWVRKQRLLLAARALTSPVSSNQTITRIAIEHGFYDGAHFTHCFKKEFGKTPQQYRREHKGELSA